MSEVLTAAALAAAIATASLPAAPASVAGDAREAAPSPALAAGLSVAGGILGLAPAIYGASPASGLNPALIAPALTIMPGSGYWYQHEWLRGALTPLGGLAAGTLGFFVVPATLRAFDPETTAASPTGAAWAQSGALLGYGAFQLFVAWDAYRLAEEKAQRARKAD